MPEESKSSDSCTLLLVAASRRRVHPIRHRHCLSDDNWNAPAYDTAGIQWSVLPPILHVGNELNYFKYLPLVAIHCATMNQCLSAIALAMDPECLGLNADLGIGSKVELCQSMPSVCRHFGEHNHTKTLPFVAISWVTSLWRFGWRVVISFPLSWCFDAVHSVELCRRTWRSQLAILWRFVTWSNTELFRPFPIFER